MKYRFHKQLYDFIISDLNKAFNDAIIIDMKLRQIIFIFFHQWSDLKFTEIEFVIQKDRIEIQAIIEDLDLRDATEITVFSFTDIFHFLTFLRIN